MFIRQCVPRRLFTQGFCSVCVLLHSMFLSHVGRLHSRRLGLCIRFVAQEESSRGWRETHPSAGGSVTPSLDGRGRQPRGHEGPGTRAKRLWRWLQQGHEMMGFRAPADGCADRVSSDQPLQAKDVPLAVCQSGSNDTPAQWTKRLSRSSSLSSNEYIRSATHMMQTFPKFEQFKQSFKSRASLRGAASDGQRLKWNQYCVSGGGQGRS
jgi:hypothetical protein